MINKDKLPGLREDIKQLRMLTKVIFEREGFYLRRCSVCKGYCKSRTNEKSYILCDKCMKNFMTWVEESSEITEETWNKIKGDK